MNSHRIKLANKAKTAKPLTDDQYEALAERIDDLENESGGLQELVEALENADDDESLSKSVRQKVKVLLKEAEKLLKIAEAKLGKETDALDIEDMRRKRDGYCEKCGHKHSTP